MNMEILKLKNMWSENKRYKHLKFFRVNQKLRTLSNNYLERIKCCPKSKNSTQRYPF